MGKKKTNAEFLLEVQSISGNEYVFLEDYADSKTKLLCRHNNCGYEWKITPTNFLTGKRCPKCAGVKKYTLEDAKKIFASKGLKLLATEYIDANTKMAFICKRHKDRGIQYRSLSAIKNTSTPGCRYCGYEQLTESQRDNDTADNIESCYAEHGLKLLPTKYQGVNAWYECQCIEHPEHGTFRKRYADVKYLNQGCPICGHEHLRQSRRNSVDYYRDIVEGRGYEFVDVEYNHRDDGGTFIYYICPNHREQGVQRKSASKFDKSGCPYCAESLGEFAVKHFFDENNISYLRNVTYASLLGVGGGKLSYDFYVPKYNLLIEFQGAQHEKPIDLFGGESQFKIQVEHDMRKTQYAKTHNFNLLEIWYFDIDNIDTILSNHIKKIEAVNCCG